MSRHRLSGYTGLVLAFSFFLTSFSFAAGTTSYTTKQGDTLWSIARKNHTTTKAIAHANGISENATLPLGKVISVPSSKTNARTPSKVVAKSNTVKQSQEINCRIHTRVDNVCLRSAANTSSSRIAMLPSGTTATLLAREGKWAKVEMDGGVRGYIHRSLLASGAGTENSRANKPVQVASADIDNNEMLIETALGLRGTRYVRGGTSRGGFDCSGFTRYIFAKYGVSLPHNSAAQSNRGRQVNRECLKPGDLVFFQTNRRCISHVGIYIGDGRFVHAASRGRGVTVDSLNSSYYSSRYRGARRVDK